LHLVSLFQAVLSCFTICSRGNRDDEGQQARQRHHPDARFPETPAEALPTLLSRLKAGGYRAVQMKAKAPVQTLAEYDAEVVKDRSCR
jgi:hypothetical protein